MNCNHFKIRSKNNKKEKRIYNYCTLLRKEIIYSDCRNCTKQDSIIKKCTINKKNCVKIKGSKHKLTKATEIPMKVKKIVWERDKHRCIYCHKYVDVYFANSHYIKRSQLGLGIEQNVVTACPNCHYKYDFGVNIQDMINYTKNYLSSLYDGWNEKNLVYRK